MSFMQSRRITVVEFQAGMDVSIYENKFQMVSHSLRKLSLNEFKEIIENVIPKIITDGEYDVEWASSQAPKPVDLPTNGKTESSFKLPEFKGKSNKISADFLRRFNGAGCQCGKQKLENYPLCARCFQRLPKEFRTALRQKKGGELEAVYNCACEFLNFPRGK